MAHTVGLIEEQQPGFYAGAGKNEAQSSAVSWAAVIAGAFVAAALSLIFLALGTGVGLSSVSPWANAGASGTAIGIGGVIWLIVVEVIASSMGGYLAGRLRTKWVNVHTDEVYFRDTAHGFLVWAVAVVITAAFLASASAAMVGGSATSETARNSQVATRAIDPNQYFIDSLFRSDLPNAHRDDAGMRAEVGAILANGVRYGELPANDKAYLAKVVSANTGLDQTTSDGRVTQVFDEVQQTADATRKAIAHSLYWLFLALLIGAFCASFSATIGGRQRDRIVKI